MTRIVRAAAGPGLALVVLVLSGCGSTAPLAPREIGYVAQPGCDAFPRGERYVADRFRPSGIAFAIADSVTVAADPTKPFLLLDWGYPTELRDYAIEQLGELARDDYVFALHSVMVQAPGAPTFDIAGYTFVDSLGVWPDLAVVVTDAIERRFHRSAVRDAIASTTVHELGHAFGIRGEPYRGPAGRLREHGRGGCVMWGLTDDADGRLWLTDPTFYPQPEWLWPFHGGFCEVCRGILRSANPVP
ncbi:MAG: hypothetical protein R3B81_01900 [bacterium]